VLALTVVAFARWPLIGFAGVWLFTTLAPTSSIVPIATEVGAERRMYLPLVAPVTLAVVGLWMLWQRYAPGRNARILTVPLAGVAVWFGAATITRNSEYSSKMTMAQTVLARWPTDVAHAMVGTELAAAGRRDEAIAEFRTAAPTFPIAAYKLGVELYNPQRFDAAVTELEGYIRREPLRLEAVEARTLIGRAYVLQHRWPESIEQFRLALSMDGSHVEAVRLMGDARFGQGDYAEAARMYRSFLAARPDDDEATINLAQALFNLGDLDGAAAEAAKLVRLARHEAVGHHLLGWVFATRGQLDDARVEFARALQLNPAQAEYRHDLDAVVEELARRR
jgi:tetratricopeptide (TPR) repeat protein